MIYLKWLRLFFNPVEFDLTTAAIPYLLVASTATSAYGAISSGKAQQSAANEQARQAEAEGRTQQIERKRALIETMAMQNVGAAAQGRTISSISALQSEDVRRAGYDETLIKGGTAAQAQQYKTAGSAAYTSGLLNAGSSLLSGATSMSKLKLPTTSSSNWSSTADTYLKTGY